MVYVFNRYSSGLQTEPDRLRRESGAMLHTIEALFFDRGNNLAVANNRRSRITVIGIYSKDVSRHKRRLLYLRTLDFELAARARDFNVRTLIDNFGLCHPFQ